MLTENELWLLSFYRTSEISGALFFGRLSKTVKAGEIQRDMTKHFADESLHAHYWTECIYRLGGEPLKLEDSYQDQYLAAAGMPVNLMEVLALTQVFEKRVISQYTLHSNIPNLKPEIRETLEKIMTDEKWHIEWIRDALKKMETQYGEKSIYETLDRFRKADQEVYQKTMNEHENHIDCLMKAKR